MNKRASFEIHVLKDKHWIIESVEAEEAAARAFAENLISRSNAEAVRVVKDWSRADGTFGERVILEKQGSAAKKDLSLGTVAEAPFCIEPADLFKLPARLCMARLFRKYLDEAGLTPLELLYNYNELRRLGDKDNLLASAMDRVAGLQVRDTDMDSRARRDALYKLHDQVAADARKAAQVMGEVPSKPLPFADLRKLSAKLPDRDYGLACAIARHLSWVRTPLGKLERICAWLEEEDARRHERLLDAFAADCLTSATVIQDLLGVQPNLAKALGSLVDLVSGRLAPGNRTQPEQAQALNRLFAAGYLPEARDTLVGRIERELKGSQPLCRNEPSQEMDGLVQVLGKLCSPDGLLGGAAMAEALTQRYANIAKLGGPSALADSVRAILGLVPEGYRWVQFLLALRDSDIAPDCENEILDRLGLLLKGAGSLDALVSPSLPPRDRMYAVARTHGLLKASALPDPLKTQLADRFDALLAKYLTDEGVIEKIDRAEDPLMLRAVRLVKFCASGCLIEGQSLQLARKAVIGHLKQPRFEEKFMEGITDRSQGERQLRDFYKLLQETGFGAA